MESDKKGKTGDWKGWRARPNNRASTWSGKADPKKDRRDWKKEQNRD